MARFCTQITVFFCDMYYVVWDQIFRQIYPVKKGNAKECSDYCTIALISHASKVMVKILQARLQQYMNCELPDVQAAFRKGRGTKIKLPTSICKRIPETHLLLFH